LCAGKAVHLFVEPGAEVVRPLHDRVPAEAIGPLSTTAMLGLSPGTGVPAARNCRTDVTNNAAAAATLTAPSGAIPDGRKYSGQAI
jgi:hypothetical protein